MPSSDSLPETAGLRAADPVLPTVGHAAAAADARSDDATPALDPAVAALLKKDDAGLVAAVVQQYDSREVLMLGWMDEEALQRTLTSGRVTFWSRSRQEYWRKGDTSGHRQWVRAVALDCDGDTLLVTVDQEGAACHTGTRTCFDGRELPVGAPPSTHGGIEAPSASPDSHAGGS